MMTDTMVETPEKSPGTAQRPLVIAIPEMIKIGSMSLSPDFSQIIPALGRIQAQVGDLRRDATNDAVNGTYVTLAAVLGMLRPLMKAEGVTLLQPFEVEGNKVRLTTLLVKGAQFVAQTVEMTAESSYPHAIGSTVTYARRYSLMSIAALSATDVDDDGNSGSGVSASTVQGAPESKENASAPPRKTRKTKEAEDSPSQPQQEATATTTITASEPPVESSGSSVDAIDESTGYSKRLADYLKKARGANKSGLLMAKEQLATFGLTESEAKILLDFMNERLEKEFAQ